MSDRDRHAAISILKKGLRTVRHRGIQAGKSVARGDFPREQLVWREQPLSELGRDFRQVGLLKPESLRIQPLGMPKKWCIR